MKVNPMYDLNNKVCISGLKECGIVSIPMTFSDVLCLVHNDYDASLVCRFDDYITIIPESSYGFKFLFTEVFLSG